jgi:hypothetical protein
MIVAQQDCHFQTVYFHCLSMMETLTQLLSLLAVAAVLVAVQLPLDLIMGYLALGFLAAVR